MIEPPNRDWAYGVTTVPARRTTLLPRTLRSLADAGFPQPHLFVDGEPDPTSWRREFDLDVTAHHPKLHATGNWITALWTLYLHHPMARRFALFQDDVVAVRNLRAYLDSVEMAERTYWNLYTAERSEAAIEGRRGFVPSVYLRNPVPPNENERWQAGVGCLGIVLPLEGVVTLLSSQGTCRKPLEYERGHHKLDGMIVNAMNLAHWKEMVHGPSLLQHTGQEEDVLGAPNPLTTMERHYVRQLARTFPGEGFDATELLK